MENQNLNDLSKIIQKKQRRCLGLRILLFPSYLSLTLCGDISVL